MIVGKIRINQTDGVTKEDIFIVSVGCCVFICPWGLCATRLITPDTLLLMPQAGLWGSQVRVRFCKRASNIESLIKVNSVIVQRRQAIIHLREFYLFTWAIKPLAQNLTFENNAAVNLEFYIPERKFKQPFIYLTVIVKGTYSSSAMIPKETLTSKLESLISNAWLVLPFSIPSRGWVVQRNSTPLIYIMH